MDLLIAPNTVAQEQADKAPASGTPGWATDGNPATGQMATDAPAWHYNMMMSELITVVKAAGITPSNSDWSQVLKAMQTIFSPAQYGVAPYSAQLAQLVGGYPIGAVVFDAAGNYWRSTQGSNLSVPGADGAKWINFFAGILTKQQADLLYLSLLGGNVTGPMDWGSKTAADTLTHRFWSAGPPAEGDAAPDATLTIAGGTPGTANKGTVALETGVFDLSGIGVVLVPDAGAAQNPVALGQIAGLTSGRLINIQRFTASGTYTPTPGATFAIGDVQAGGGAGGGVTAQSDMTIGVSGPGAGGAFARIRFSLSGINSIPVTVGGGGVNVPGNTGGNGAASSIGSLATAPGGYGGHSGPPGAAYWIDNAGQTGASPSIDASVVTLLSLPVQAPTGGITLAANSVTGGKCGRGGASFYGMGAPEVRAEEAVPSDGPVPGSGGSGNCVSALGPARPGGNGARGLVTIWEFA